MWDDGELEFAREGMRDVCGPLVDLSGHSNSLVDFVAIPAVIPSGVFVPLHSHADHEIIIMIGGCLSVWLEERWSEHARGSVIDIRPNIKHALRNQGSTDVLMVLTTTVRMQTFFREISVPKEDRGISMPKRLKHAELVSQRYGYWNGDPDQQRRIGIDLA